MQDSGRQAEGSILKRARDLLRGERRTPAQPELLLIDGQHLGDILTERAVTVNAGGAVGGNITAPAVLVRGIVHGFLATRELDVEPDGQVWGDVYAARVQIATGGKVHGWVTTLDEGTVDLLRDGGLNVSDLPVGGLDNQTSSTAAARPAENKQREGALTPAIMLRQLQAEAATAILARAELEAQFERRLGQAIGAEESGIWRQREPSSEENSEHQSAPQAVSAERLRKLQMALGRSLQRVRQLEADVAYWQAISIGSKRADEGDVERSSDNWSKLSQTVASAQLTRFQDIIEAHGERLARLQAELVERDLSLERSRQLIRRQTNELQELKHRAGERIKQLEGELDQRRRAMLEGQASKHFGENVAQE